jgi:hypothetical protein
VSGLALKFVVRRFGHSGTVFIPNPAFLSALAKNVNKADLVFP